MVTVEALWECGDTGKRNLGAPPNIRVETRPSMCMIPCVADFSMTFLGTGTSVGVPVIGCKCAVCVSDDFRNQRTRSSVLVRAGETAVLVDSGPDLRAQALREGLVAVDAVIYTHSHLDHVVGFDELRAFCWRKAVRCHCMPPRNAWTR